MNRRDFLQRMLGVTAITAAGLVVPARRTYVFFSNNSLARKEGHFDAMRALIDDDTYANGYVFAWNDEDSGILHVPPSVDDGFEVLIRSGDFR